MTLVDVLSRFARRPQGDEAMRCELCAAALGDRHAHVVDLQARRLCCACGACAVLFRGSSAPSGVASTALARDLAERGRHDLDGADHTLLAPLAAQSVVARYRTVPSRVLFDPATELSDDDWALVGVPVRTAFLFSPSSPTPARHFAVYPSPAGPTESEIDAASWTAFAERCPLTRELAPDVEALLVRGAPHVKGLQHLLVPIDACYELVARVRTSWKGFDGAGNAQRAIDAFVLDLAQRSRRFVARAEVQHA